MAQSLTGRRFDGPNKGQVVANSKRAAWRHSSGAMVLAITLIGTPSLTAAAEQVATPPLAVAAPTTTATFLALSDIHLTAQSQQACGSSPSQIETNPALWSAAQAETKQVIQLEKPAFAIYLGDLPSHCDTRPDTDNDFTAALDGLANIAGTGTKIIYIPGNNDSRAGDYEPFTSNGTPLDLSPAWKGSPVLNAQPGDMIDAANIPQGYYSVYAVQATATAPALRVLALNTNMFTFKYHQNVASTQADANAQLEWLSAQLKDARSKHEKVIIAMHAPPGVDGYGGGTMWDANLLYTGQDPDLAQGWVQKTFLQLVADYRPEITGLLSSHTHYNEIRRLRDCSRKLPRLGAFTELDVAIPAITTDHGNNPSIKMFSYDDQFEWTENRTYHASDATGAGWSTNAPLSFDRVNYPCPNCTAGDSLMARIASLDRATRINTSKKLAALMIAWLKVGAPPPGSPGKYMLSLDVTCEVPK
jgi:hypothetical protein